MKIKYDAQPNLQLIASQLGLDTSAISVLQQADGTWIVATAASDPIPDAVQVAIEQKTASDSGLSPGADIADIVSS